MKNNLLIPEVGLMKNLMATLILLTASFTANAETWRLPIPALYGNIPIWKLEFFVPEQPVNRLEGRIHFGNGRSALAYTSIVRKNTDIFLEHICFDFADTIGCPYYLWGSITDNKINYKLNMRVTNDSARTLEKYFQFSGEVLN